MDMNMMNFNTGNTNTNLSDSTLVKRAKAMIYAGATWETLTRAFGKSESTLRRKIKASYKTEGGHKRLLEKARENSRLAKEAREKMGIPADEEDIKEIIVTETGYLLDHGVQGVMNESLDIFIPHFCVYELEKLSRSYTSASEVLTLIYSTNRITTINQRGKEVLFEDPSFPVKNRRSIGVVSLCCELFCQDFKVRLLTNSSEVAKLAKEQGMDIQVVLVQRADK